MLIRPYQPSDDIGQVTQLLHEAYASLEAMGFRYLATHQNDEVTRQRLESGDSVLAVDNDGRIIATISLYPPRDSSDSTYYTRAGHWSFGQFAVDPALQRQGIGTRLLAFVEQKARQAGATHLALDTARDATHLVRWYQRLGFVEVERVSWEVTNYESLILSKAL